MQFTRSHVIGFSLALAFCGVAIYGATYIADLIRERTDAPSDIERTLDLGLTLEGGATLDLSTLEGKVVVVAAWATWCPSCTQMLVDLARAKERFGNDVAILAVNRAEEQSVIDDFKRAYTIPEGVTYISDADDRYFSAISGRSMPEMLIYSKEGIVAEHRLDAPSFDALMTTIDRLISQ